VWTALGGDLKPSLDIQISTPIDTGVRYPAGPLVLEEGRFLVGEETVGRRGRPGRSAADHPKNGEGVRIDETIQGGTPAQPGRILRVRNR
jgi:hypothetical protein